MAQQINLTEVLEIIESGSWFSCEVFTANVNQGTGGKLMVIPKCRIARNQSNSIGARAARKLKQDKQKDANQRENFTRNIELVNRDIITIHPILIHRINNHYVL